MDEPRARHNNNMRPNSPTPYSRGNNGPSSRGEHELNRSRPSLSRPLSTSRDAQRDYHGRQNRWPHGERCHRHSSSSNGRSNGRSNGYSNGNQEETSSANESRNPKRRLSDRYSTPKKQRAARDTLESFDAELFPKLDVSKPEHKRRLQQRRRMIMFGKNTVGYEEYLKKVPRHRRKVRSMDHPSTPDHTLDIPTKRWQGLVKAWRVALHQYDPPNLPQHTSTAANCNLAPRPLLKEKCVLDQQIAKAKAEGLQVDFRNACTISDPLSNHETTSPSSFKENIITAMAAPEGLHATKLSEEREHSFVDLPMDEEEAYQRTMRRSENANGLMDSAVQVLGHSHRRRPAIVASPVGNGGMSYRDQEFLEEGIDSDDEWL